MADPQLLTGLGSALSIFLAATGSAIASAEGGIYALRKKGITAFVPIIISGVLAIYGIIISILLVGKMENTTTNSNTSADELTEVSGYRNLSAGLSVGLACLASGLGIARFLKHLNTQQHPTTTTVIADDDNSDPNDRPESQPFLIQHHHEPHPTMMTVGVVPQENFIHLCMSLCFLEAIGLYGLIVALFLIGK